MLIRLGVHGFVNLRAFFCKTNKAHRWMNAHNDETIQSKIVQIYIPGPLQNKGGTTEILMIPPDVYDHMGVLSRFNDEGK